MYFIKKHVRAIAVFSALGFALTGGLYVVTQRQRVSLCAYQPSVHRPFIEKFFHDNWFWMVSEYSTEFSLDYILNHMVSSIHPQQAKPLTLTMLCKKNEPLGFIAYHPVNEDEGKILFVGVDKQARGHHYARKLLEHAFAELKKMGCKTVSLVTRTTNLSAQSTYKAEGFVETGRDNEFVAFSRHL